MKVKLCRDVQEALEETGLHWTITEGTKHYHIRLAGRLAGILPKGGKGRGQSGGNRKQTIKDIRRKAAEIKGGGGAAA